MIRNPNATCFNCPYWDSRPMNDYGHGLCVRRAPSLLPLPEQQGWGDWPKAAPGSFCGDHPDFAANTKETPTNA